MLTYDDVRRRPADPIKELIKKNTPDQIECGENNDFWFFVRRSSRNLEVMCKQTGRIVAKGQVSTLAAEYKLTPAQLSAAKTGLTL